MTGYGKAVVAFKEKKIHVEVKSLNSKQLDLNTRIAPLYREKEMEMRQMVAECGPCGELLPADKDYLGEDRNRHAGGLLLHAAADA